MLEDHTAYYVERRFSIYKPKVLDRVHDILTLLISRMTPWSLLSTPNLYPSSPRTADISLLYKSKVVNPVDNIPVYDVCLLLHREHTTLLSRFRRGFGGRTIAWNVKKHTTTRIGTSLNQDTLVACVRKRLACTNHLTQYSVNTVLVYFSIVHVSRITNTGPISNHICESFYCTYCNKEVIRNH